MQESSDHAEQRDGGFADQASEPQPGLLWEFFDFLLHNKKWWLTPIILVLLGLAAVIFWAPAGAAPFIYTMF